MHAQEKAAADNGVNVAALLGARDALTQAPAAAQFKWRATCNWVNGTHARSSIHSLLGLGEEQKHRTTYTTRARPPRGFRSRDKAATPVEIVLAGLAGCLTAGIAAVA